MNGKELRALRLGLRFTQWDLGLLVGLTPETISRYENGHAKIPLRTKNALERILSPERKSLDNGR